VNLAREVVESLGRLSFGDLAGPVAASMPHRFLDSTLRLQPTLEPVRRRVEELVERFRRPDGWHRNPEVFGAIARLSEGARAGSDPAPRLAALEMHAASCAAEGAGEPVPDPAVLEDGPYRTLGPAGRCYRVAAGRAEPLPMDLLFRLPFTSGVGGFEGSVLLPHPGLFSDLLEPHLYPDGDDPYEAVVLLETTTAGLALLARFEPEVAEDFARVVQRIVLTPDLGDDLRWSYNLRLAYFGAVFVNPFRVGVAGMAESLLHEYVHQRLWQWWAFEPPDGLPGFETTVLSPVTERPKPAPVMVQALVIYVAVHRLLAAALVADGLPPAERDGVEERVARLRRAIPILHGRLREVVPAGSSVARLLGLARERFEGGEPA
jgi:hypothetical protein